MIFSFSNTMSETLNFELSRTDIFCFFHSQNAVSIPSNLWLQSTFASLKMKNNVLILEENPAELPLIHFTQRWHVGDKFLWLAPRSLSVLSEATHEITGCYEKTKRHLSTFK